MELKDKVVIVTGASSGIGRATAELLGKQGAKVALVARSKDKLTQLSKEIPGSLVVVADMSVEKDIKQMVKMVFEHYGRIDILVNNAGVGYASRVEDIDMKKFCYLFDLNLVGPVVAMQEVIPYMKKAGGGTIVNISSNTSSLYIPNLGSYSSLKRALNGISLTAREELKGDNIVVSVVYPYITKTDFGKNALKNDNRDYHQIINSKANVLEGDSSELVAEKILEAIKTGNAEVYVRNFANK